MNYREFVCAVEERLNQNAGGDIKVSVYSAIKNNSTERLGVLIEQPGVNISPTIYLEEYFESYEDGKSIEEIAEEIWNFYESVRREDCWNYSRVTRYEGVKNRIVFKLINTEKNREFLKTVPHRPYLDLSIVFYVLLEVNCEGSASMVVTNEYMKTWQVTPDILWEDAGKNVMQLLPAEFITMHSALWKLMQAYDPKAACRGEGNLLEGDKSERDSMYVLSNRIRNYGAACIAYPFVAEMIGDILEEDYYILPSSVHELVIIPRSNGTSSPELNKMICEINDTQVAEEEVLSDHYYRYRRRTGKVTTA